MKKLQLLDYLTKLMHQKSRFWFEKLLYVDLKENLDVSNFLGLFFVITPGENTYKDISLLNKYIKLYDDKILGWFCIEE